MKRLASVVLLLVAAAMLLWFLRGNHNAQEATTSGGGEPTTGTVVAGNGDDATGGTSLEQPSKVTESGAVVSVPTASAEPTSLLATATYRDALRLASTAAGTGADSLNDRMRLASVCSTASMEKRRALASQPDASDSRRNATRFFETYCNAPPESIEWLASQIDAAPPSDLGAATTLHETHAIDREFALNEAQRILEETRSAEALRAAFDFLEIKGKQPMDFVPEDAQPTNLRIDGNAVRKLAIDMVACDLSRACGPGSVNAWVACTLLDHCVPGISMDQVWRHAHSPAVYDEAVRQAGFLRQRRRS
jgi:hypothetical protein